MIKRLAVLIGVFSLMLGLRVLADPSFEIHDVAEGSNPAIAFDKKGRLHLALETCHKNSNLTDMRYAKSIDGARTWTSPVTISDHGESSVADLVVNTKGVVHVDWGYTSSIDNGVGLFLACSLDEGKTKSEILGRASIDNGKHFSLAVCFSNREDNSIHPDVAIAGSRLFAV